MCYTVKDAVDCYSTIPGVGYRMEAMILAEAGDFS